MEQQSSNPGAASSAAMPTDRAAKKNTGMAILSYIGPLVIVSYLVANNDPFVKFHIKQGVVLLVIELIVWAVGFVFFYFFLIWMLLRLVDLVVFILAIIGIVNAAKGEEKPLPIVGGFAEHVGI